MKRWVLRMLQKMGKKEEKVGENVVINFHFFMGRRMKHVLT